jgi:hypothetical protein
VVVGLVMLALVGVGAVAAFGAGARAAHRTTQHAREVSRMGGNLTRALVTGAVIVGVQWVVVAYTADPRAWGVALGVPALFAGSAIARMFAVTEIIHGHSGRGNQR